MSHSKIFLKSELNFKILHIIKTFILDHLDVVALLAVVVLLEEDVLNLETVDLNLRSVVDQNHVIDIVDQNHVIDIADLSQNHVDQGLVIVIADQSREIADRNQNLETVAEDLSLAIVDQKDLVHAIKKKFLLEIRNETRKKKKKKKKKAKKIKIVNELVNAHPLKRHQKKKIVKRFKF